MADKNRKLPGHTWITDGTKVVDNSSRFVYSCTKCPAKTLNGEPLKPPYDTECGKSGT